MAKVLVLGGTGLIGAGITRFLLEAGHEVTHYNRGLTDTGSWPDVSRIAGDRRDYAAFEAQIHGAGSWDCVIDMICFKATDADSAIRAFRGRVGQFIFCSTVDVYTKPAARYPITEEAEREPSTAFPYAWEKARCERLFEAAQARGDFDVTIIRPAHTYADSGSIIHAFRRGTYFLDRIRKGKPVIVHGDGSSLWASCHRDDVARAFCAAVDNPAALGQAYHVAAEEWLTWNQIYGLVADAMNMDVPELVHIPTSVLVRLAPTKADWCDVNFKYNNIFDNAKAKRDLGFKYTIPLDEGIGRMIDYLDRNQGIEDSDLPEFAWYDHLIGLWEEQCRQLEVSSSTLTL